jgi:F0F1-type ATP synthase assembly protein I
MNIKLYIIFSLLAGLIGAIICTVGLSLSYLITMNTIPLEVLYVGPLIGFGIGIFCALFHVASFK